MAYSMDGREWRIWSLHCSGMTVAEVAKAAGVGEAETHSTIVFLWRMHRMHDGLVRPNAEDGGGDGYR